MILEWPTTLLGKSIQRVEVGDVGKNVIKKSADVAIRTDNVAPKVIFNNLKWKFSGEPGSAFNLPGRNLLVTRPTIHRGATPKDVDVQFDASVSANHLRHANIYVVNCNGTGLSPLGSPVPNTYRWHQFVTDHLILLSARAIGPPQRTWRVCIPSDASAPAVG